MNELEAQASGVHSFLPLVSHCKSCWRDYKENKPGIATASMVFPCGWGTWADVAVSFSTPNQLPGPGPLYRQKWTQLLGWAAGSPDGLAKALPRACFSYVTPWPAAVVGAGARSRGHIPKLEAREPVWPGPGFPENPLVRAYEGPPRNTLIPSGATAPADRGLPTRPHLLKVPPPPVLCPGEQAFKAQISPGDRPPPSHGSSAAVFYLEER